MLKSLLIAINIIYVSIAFPSWIHAFSYYWTVYEQKDGLLNNNVTTVSIDPGGYIWIGMQGIDTNYQGGINILDPMDAFVPPYNTSDGLCSNVISGIAFESISEENHNNLDNGSIWITTRKGLNVLDRKGIFTTIDSGNSPLLGDNIATIFIDKENTKWISVWGRGVCCVDANFNWGTYTTADGLCSHYILSILEDSSGNIWFGSKDNGVSCLDRNGNWIHFSSENSGLIGNNVRTIVEEPPNKLWFVTRNGVSVFDGQNWMSYTTRNSPMGSFIPTTLIIDGSGNKWIGTELGGVFKLDNSGMWTHFHQENTSLPDNMIQALAVDERQTVWIATPSGLCSFGKFPQRPQYRLFHQEFQQPPTTGLGKGTYYPFEHGIIWENIGNSELKSEISFSLPSYFYGGKSWFYAVLWSDHDFSFNGLHYSIIGNRRGNLKVRFKGNFSQTIFLTCGRILSSHMDLAIDKKVRYPFPISFPEELEEFLMPGDHIPSNDPELENIVQALIQTSGKTDMYKTVLDIVYSKLIQHLGLDDKKIGLLKEKEPGEESAQISSVKDVYYVLKNRKGDQHAKARLVCTLARAAGIPARIVMSIGGSVWCQVWISGLGWASVETTYPVYDYIRPLRTYMPKIFYPAEHALASVSGKDDDVGRILWNPHIKAYYIETSPVELKNYRQISMSKILLIKIVSESSVPENARIQLCEDIFMIAKQKEDSVLLLFHNKAGREIKEIPLSFKGLSHNVNVENRLFWKFIPRRIGEILIIENFECRAEPEAPYSFMPPVNGELFKQIPIR